MILHSSSVTRTAVYNSEHMLSKNCPQVPKWDIFFSTQWVQFFYSSPRNTRAMQCHCVFLWEGPEKNLEIKKLDLSRERCLNFEVCGFGHL